MMRKTFLSSGIMIATILSACASHEKAAEPKDEVVPPYQESSNSANKDKTPEKVEEPKVESRKTSPSEANSNLSEAIRSQNDEAIYRAATQVLMQSPNDVKAQNALGVYHYRKGRFLAAQYFFSRAIKASPNVSDLHNNLALVSLAMKEKRQALLSFRKALELDSNNATAAANVGAIYIQEKDYNKAIIPLEMAVKRMPKDYRVLVNYGVALAGQQKFTQAKDQYSAALAVNSTGREALFNLAIVQIEQLKNFQEGLDLLNKLKFLGSIETARSRINSLENTAKAGLK